MNQLKVFTFSMIGVIMIAALAILSNKQMLTISNGGEIKTIECEEGIVLANWEQEGDIYSFYFSTDQILDGFHIMLKKYSGEPLWVNEKLYEPEDTNNRNVYYIENTEGSTFFKITLETNASGSIYLGSGDVITRWLNLKAISDGICVALNIFLLFYALFLYYFKRSEDYLLYFSFYLGIMLIWSALTITSSDWSRYVSRMIFVILAVNAVLLCLKLTDITLPLKIRPWFSWKFYLPVIALYFLFINYAWIRILLLLILSMQSLYVLSHAFSKKVTGSLLLICGMIFIAGTRPVILLFSATVFAVYESLPIYIVRSTRLLDTPFLICCFFFVTRKFAFHFSESERLARDLDKLVRQRTEDLVKQQEQKQSMMMNIFHDLRTPLFTISQYLEILSSNHESLPEILPILQQRASFVTELTEQLFLAAKLERNQIMLSCKRVNLSDIIRDHSNSISEQASCQGITLKSDIEESLYVWGDALRLEQIAQNLISNALHYTPQGGSIHISLEVKGEQVIFRVRDNGKGISFEEQQHIFDRYFYTQENNKHDSTGLGLTIAKELTLLHRGEVTCNSELGKGTEFIASFPLLEI